MWTYPWCATTYCNMWRQADRVYKESNPAHAAAITKFMYNEFTAIEKKATVFLVLLSARTVTYSSLDERCVSYGDAAKQFGTNLEYNLNYLAVQKLAGKGVLRQISSCSIPCTHE